MTDPRTVVLIRVGEERSYVDLLGLLRRYIEIHDIAIGNSEESSDLLDAFVPVVRALLPSVDPSSLDLVETLEVPSRAVLSSKLTNLTRIFKLMTLRSIETFLVAAMQEITVFLVREERFRHADDVSRIARLLDQRSSGADRRRVVGR